MNYDFWMYIFFQGLIISVMALGVYITYKLLDFPDLSTDSTFTLGGASVALLIGAGINPYLALIGAMLFGVLAGLMTGILHVYFKIANILSGIIVMSALYSVNMRVLKGKANVSLMGSKTIFTGASTEQKVLIMIVILSLVAILFSIFLKTKLGYMLKATGDNQQMVTALGVDHGLIKLMGIGLANGLVALSGALLTQSQNFADIGMGTGIVIKGLAAIIIGSAIKGRKKDVTIIFVILGALSYEVITGLALRAKFIQPSDYKLIIAVIVVAILTANNLMGGKKNAAN